MILTWNAKVEVEPESEVLVARLIKVYAVLEAFIQQCDSSPSEDPLLHTDPLVLKCGSRSPVVEAETV